MSEIQVIKAAPQSKLYKNVCAYARVSNGKDAMLHSLSAQVSFYSSYIQSHSGWIYRGVYSDEAITGTKENRPGLQKMLEDCRNGMIDIIIVKSISRLARNTNLFLKTIRELKELEVDVFFEEEKIRLLSAEGEFLLTVYASYAQEESRSVSENMKWRIKKDFEEGIMWGGTDCLGYKVVNKKFVMVPEQAALVKHIFDLALAGNGKLKIAKILNSEGYKTMRGCEWQDSIVGHVLKNITYTGDLLLQKTYRKDHMTKRNIRNYGEKKMYLVENDHEPIISKETFNKVQELMNQRDFTKPFKMIRYPFTGIVKCGICGGNYRHKTTKYKDFWQCSLYEKKGVEFCNSHKVPTSRLEEAVQKAFDADKYDDGLIERISKIEVFNQNRILVFFKDDRPAYEYYWTPDSRKWTDEMKERARIKSKAEVHNKERGVDGKWLKLQ